MGLKDLFKSKAERDKEVRKTLRQKKRQAERVVEGVKERIDGLKNDRDKSWAEARKYLTAGQKGAAQRCLQSVRADEQIMDQLEKKRWVFDRRLTKLDMAKTDQEFIQALSEISALIDIDPEAVAEGLDEVEDKLDEQQDIDSIWNKAYDKEMVGVESKATDTIPTVEEMMKSLEDEVVADVRGDKIVGTESSGGSTINEEIGKGREKLRKLMEDDK